MTSDEFVLALENLWGKTLTPEQRAAYTRKLGRFPPDQRFQILDRTLETCKYFPKIADIFQVATGDLLIKPAAKKKQSRGCTKCEGTTWIHVILAHPLGKGETHEAVKPCECTPRKIKFPELDGLYAPQEGSQEPMKPTAEMIEEEVPV